MKYLFFITFAFFATTLLAEERWWIEFTDKGSMTLDKASVSQRALDRRMRTAGRGLDEGDKNLEERYVNEIVALGARVHVRSRWLNAISVEAMPRDALAIIGSLPFVKAVYPVACGERLQIPVSLETQKPEIFSAAVTEVDSIMNYGPSATQIKQIGVDKFHQKGINGSSVAGKEMYIGMMDSGFRWKVPESTKNLKVIAEHDFVFNDSVTANQDSSEQHGVADDPGQDSHGTAVLSTIAGYAPGELIGPAYGATYILAKTEDIRTEKPVEEDNYVAALEWMESLGVDVTSSSLGYSTYPDSGTSWTYRDFNGHTTPTARAVNHASALGVVCVTAAGNGGDAIHSIVTPGDADSALTIGAVRDDDTLAGFSSRGPNSSGILKPDVCALGVNVYCALRSINTYQKVSGTSLATPLAAGAAALLRQQFPTASPGKIRDMLRTTASRASMPDSNYGWGIINLPRAAGMVDVKEKAVRNDAFALGQSFPNPVYNNTISIPFVLEQEALVDVDILDRIGRLVQHFSQLHFDEGPHILTLDVRHFSPGVYYYRMNAGRGIQTKSMILFTSGEK